MLMTSLTWRLGALLFAGLLVGCASRLPDEPPPLLDLEEPLAWFAEPDDEAARQALPLGTFSGCVVGEARETLDALLGESEGVLVASVVENSPADVAGVKAGDLLLEARLADGPPRALRYEADWRKVELDAAPGSTVHVSFDRANRRTGTSFVVVPRMRAPGRQETRRVREEEKVGVVLRTATEVEARGAGLGPGGGVVVVGLSRRSPWRHAGLRFGDLVVAVDDHAVSAPELVLERIRAAGERMKLEYVRDGAHVIVDTALTRRAQDTREFYIPLLVDYESDRGRSDTSILLGLFRHEETQAAWRIRLLWFIRFGRGDADELLKVDS